MKSFVITLPNNSYSQEITERCIQSAKKYNTKVEKFIGVSQEQSEDVMKSHGLKFTWADGNKRKFICSKTKLLNFPYTAKHIPSLLGCVMSHYLLWKKCIELNKPVLILEHDSIFIRELPKSIEFKGICQINDPDGATRKGRWWSEQMKTRGSIGVHEKTWITSLQERHVPDGLAGNSAYMIKPWAAQELLNKIDELGLWVNDALMCKQLFPYLEEYYPFITRVIQKRSTTAGQ